MNGNAVSTKNENTRGQTTSKQNLRDIYQTLRFTMDITWKTSKNQLIIIIGMSMILSILPTIQTYAWRELINSGAGALDFDKNVLETLVFWGVLSVILTLLQVILQQFKLYIEGVLLLRLQLDVNVLSFEHASHLDLSFFENPEFQDMIERSQSDMAVHFSKYILNVISFFQIFFQSLGVTLLLLSIDGFAVLVIVPVAIPYLWIQWRIARARYDKKYIQTTRRRWLRYYLSCVMNRNFVSEVKINNLAPYLQEKYKNTTMEINEENLDLLKEVHLKGVLAFQILFSITFYLILGYAGIRILEGYLTVGDLVVYASTVTALQGFMKNVSKLSGDTLEEALYITDWKIFMETKSSLNDSGSLKPDNIKGRIELDGVTFSYPNNNHNSLENISLTIEPGETVAIVGENGAGKSTLIKLLTRFYDVDHGSVKIDGINIKDIDMAHLYRHFSYVPQNFNKFEASVRDNIAFGDWEKLIDDPEYVRKFTQESGIHEMVMRMPDGYDTHLGRMFDNYDPSGGQWQQIAITRALIRNAQIIILDEPTSNLDAGTEYEIFTQFKKLVKDRTAIIISHRFSTISIADRIVVVNRGVIVEQGTHAELVEAGGYYSRMYEMQKEQLPV